MTGGSTTTATMTGDLARYPVTPQYLLGAELTHYTSATATQSRHITTHAVAAGTVTLTVQTWTLPVNGDAWEIHELGGRGFRKAQYDDAINTAIDSIADGYFTDTFSVYFGMERGGTNQIAGQPRHEYPVPASLNYLYDVSFLDVPSAAANPLGNIDTNRALADATARTRLWQGFQVQETGFYEWFCLALREVGTVANNLILDIMTNSSGVPSGTTVTDGTSDTITGTTVDPRYRYIPFRFDPPIFLDSGTQYHMVLRSSGAVDGSNYWQWAEDDDNSYGDGTAGTYDAATYTAVSGSDFCFAIFPSSSRWIHILPKRGWSYRRIGDDVLYIPGHYTEGTPIRIAGSTAIAEVSTETASVPIRPEYVEAYAIQYLLSTQPIGGKDSYFQAARHWADQILRSPKPVRNLPSNAIRVYS